MRWPWQRKRETLAPPNVPGDWMQSLAWCEWESPRNVIAGEQSYDGALAKLAGPTCKDGYCFAVVVRLVREPTNPYDRNAIRAEVEGELVGYLRLQIAEQLAGRLDAAECSSF